MDARVAVLEEIAASNLETLREIKEHLRCLDEAYKAEFDCFGGIPSGDAHGYKANFRRLEEHQRGDFRLLLSAGAAATIGLAALMAHGFHWF